MSLSREKQDKRTRGEFACAECRRLKIRCNKQVPCSTCIRRGCEILCPNSTMPPGDGSRFVCFAEEFLRQKIAKMEERMNSLEDALVIIRGSGSDEPYLLLGNKWPNGEVEWIPGVGQARDLIVDNEFNKYGLADVLGALYLDDTPPSDLTISGNSESLLLQAKAFIAESSSPAKHREEINSSYLPSEITAFYKAFPFTPPGISTEVVQDLIESYLPPLSRATALCETFLQSTSWMFSIVSRQQILGQLIPAIYRHADEHAPSQLRLHGPHDISLLFVVFAIGALVDPSLPPYSVEGQHYHILSRAALCLHPVLAQRSVATIKALHLMSVYNGMCDIDNKLDDSHSLLSMAARVALQIGFHQDPSVWGIAGKEAYERRTYFWDLLHGTLWQSLIAGQPPVIAPSLIHCRLPTKEEEDMYQSGEVPTGFGTWSFSFIVECIVPVVEVTQTVHPPPYDAILALDCKIREFAFSIPPASSNGQISGEMQSFVSSHLRELTLLFLHRSFFARALSGFPGNPLNSPFRHSFLTCYQSATWILTEHRKQFAHQPALCSRMWRIWSFTFSAAIIIASVAIQRSVKLEPEPFEQLDLACILFREAARTSVRAQRALPVLLRLRREAAKIRLGTLHCFSEMTSSPLERDHHQGVRDAVDSPIRLAHYSAPGMSPSGVPLASPDHYMQAHLLPVAYPLRAKTVEEPYQGTEVRVSSEQHSSYGELPSCSSVQGSHKLPSALYASHPPDYGVALEDRRSSLMHGHTGTHMHYYSARGL